MLLLDTLRAAGLTVTADGDRLIVAPKDRLTPALRQQMAAHKAELLALLAAENAPEWPQDAQHTPAAPIDQQRPTASGVGQPGAPDHAGGAGYGACRHDWRLAGPPLGGIRCDGCGLVRSYRAPRALNRTEDTDDT